MIYINHITTATPPTRLSQDRVVEMGRDILRGKIPFVDQALQLFRNAGVDNRFLVDDVDNILAHPDLEWRNAMYVSWSKQLGVTLLQQLFDETDLKPSDIDMIISTSCTGFMIPAVDAHLINHFKMRPDVVRMPITELGCAAGAMAISRAHDFLRAQPQARVVVLAIELPSLTYQNSDHSVANLVSAALFGDGGAAALMSSAPSNCALHGTRSHFFYQTEHLMGFDLRSTGFQIVLDKAIPELIEEGFDSVIDDFLDQHTLTRREIENVVFHPGGRRIMDTLRDVLGLEESALRHSRNVLSNVGNLSSASILWVLKATIEGDYQPGWTLMTAFGPGFNAEMILAELIAQD